MKTRYFLIPLALTLGLALTLLFSLALMGPSRAQGTTYYVNATTGDDGRTPQQAQNPATPWKTIAHAAATVPAGTAASPNVIEVAGGAYNASVNGEVFPIEFANPNVRLSGPEAGAATIDGEGIANVISITVPGITVESFTIQGAAANGIVVSAGGFVIQNNIFQNVANGIDWFMDQAIAGSTYAVPGISVESNTFTVTQEAINFEVLLDGGDTAIQASIGTIDILSNTIYFDGAGVGDILIDIESLEINQIDGGSASIGAVHIADNNLYGGGTGISFYGRMEYLTDTLVTVGDVFILGNAIEGQYYSGISVDYYDAQEWRGATMATFGNLEISGNEIDTSMGVYGYGIDVSDMGYWENFYEDAMLTVGDLVVEENVINSNLDGVYIYYTYLTQLYDNASIATGDILIAGNTITTTNVLDGEGVYVDLDEVGYNVYADTVTSMGNVTITDNRIHAARYGICYYLYGIAYNIEEQAAVRVGETRFTDNTINAGSDGIYVEYENVAYEMHGDSTLVMGDAYIQDNNVSSGADGLYITYSDYEVGTDNDGNSYAELPDHIITGNDFVVSNYGLYFNCYSNPDDTYGNALTDYGGLRVDDNTFRGGGGYTEGVYVYYEDICEDCYDGSSAIIGDITVSGNTIADFGSGVYLYFDDLGYNYDYTGTTQLGDLLVAGNVVSDVNVSGINARFSGIRSEASATTTVGSMSIVGNEVISAATDGIYVYYNVWASGDGTSTAGPVLVRGNRVNGCGDNGIEFVTVVTTDTHGVATMGPPHIAANSIFDCDTGVYLNLDQNASVFNNFLIYNTTYGARVDTSAVADLVHNTIVGPFPFPRAPDSPAAITAGVHVITGTVHITNSMSGRYDFGINNVGGVVSEDYNLFRLNDTDLGGTITSGGHSISPGNPAFVNPLLGDYHITANSDALDAGTATNVRWDIDGNPRPIGGGYDIGADEFGFFIYLPAVLRNSL